MANSMDKGGEFWLPSEFRANGDGLVGKESFKKNGLTNFGFPNEFPYEFGSYGSSSALSSPVESVVGSTETESDEEDLLTVLTHQLTRSTIHEKAQISTHGLRNLEKPFVLSGSPQSTLSAVGRWSGNVSPNGPSQVPSPPETPLDGNDAWDLIYAAAGQVARLKMNGGDMPPNVRGLLGPPRILNPLRHPSPPVKNPITGFYASQFPSHNFSQTSHLEHARKDQILKQQCSSIWGKYSQQSPIKQQVVPENRRFVSGGGFESNGGYGRPVAPSQSAWPPLQVQHQNQNQSPQHGGGSGMRAVFVGGSGMKRECAGTGVFLPRKYGNPSEPRKKTGCSSALPPARVFPAQNKNLDAMTGQSQSDFQAQAQAHFGGTGFVPEYDIPNYTMMARRNALLTQQQIQNLILRLERSMNHEQCLPQEWTYSDFTLE